MIKPQHILWFILGMGLLAAMSCTSHTQYYKPDEDTVITIDSVASLDSIINTDSIEEAELMKIDRLNIQQHSDDIP